MEMANQGVLKCFRHMEKKSEDTNTEDLSLRCSGSKGEVETNKEMEGFLVF